MKSKKLALKFPSRERPKHFFNCLEEYISCIEDKQNTFFIVSLDVDDPTLSKYEERMNNYNNIHYFIGTSKNKIDAVNRDLNIFDWDIATIICDDTHPTTKGFDNIIRNDFDKYFPDLDGVIYHDNQISRYCKCGYEVAYHPSMGKTYWQRFGYFIYPEYISGYADIDLATMALSLNKYKRISDCGVLILEKRIKGDKLYLKNFESSLKNDKRIWNKRKEEISKINPSLENLKHV